jgi:hypothetical protein
MSQHHPASRRTPSKSENPDDLFVAKVLEVSNWAASHRQALIGIAVVVAVVVAGGLYWRSYQTTLVNQATQELVTIQQTRALGDPEQAKADLQLYLQRFSGTTAADEARLLLGQLELETGNAQLAIEALQPLSGSRSPLGMQATFLLAAAQEDAGDRAEAERLYLTVANRSDMSFLVRDALAQAARIRFAEGNYAGAVQLYQEVLTYFEDGDPQRSVFEMRLAEARALQSG